ncbi:MAG: serine/threonine-protein phosphatase, partial [Deltaproteobacteria bacterium]|nr:serine/threonine-protein phosphatase [Deltaproteobacteria bacterium]
MPKKIFAGKTDVGLRRQNNEDVFLVSPEFDFCLAADGMGGAAAGEVASEIFAQTALAVFSANPNRSEKDTLYRVQKAYYTANEKILEHVSAHPDHKGMGCTAELLAFFEDHFILGHIGDSRTYRLRNDVLEQLTEDHTLVQQQLQEGLISEDEIRNHPMRHVIFRAVGIKEELTIDVLKGKTHPADLFLLCSDGLSDMIEDEHIHEILCADTDIEHKTENLIESAKAAGGID